MSMHAVTLLWDESHSAQTYGTRPNTLKCALDGNSLYYPEVSERFEKASEQSDTGAPSVILLFINLPSF